MSGDKVGRKGIDGGDQGERAGGRVGPVFPSGKGWDTPRECPGGHSFRPLEQCWEQGPQGAIDPGHLTSSLQGEGLHAWGLSAGGLAHGAS